MNSHRFVVRGFALGALGAVLLAPAMSGADPTQGLCNAVVAQALGTGIQVANKGPTAERCTEIGSALMAALTPPCLDLTLANEFGVLKAASAPKGGLSNLGTLICTGLDRCEFTPLPFGFCPGFPSP